MTSAYLSLARLFRAVSCTNASVLPNVLGATRLTLDYRTSPDLADTETQSKEREAVKEKKVQKRYNEEFKRQAVELLIHSGKRQAQVARELGVSDYTLTLWKRAYLGQLKPGELEGKSLSPEEMLEKIRQLQKENEYLKRQREILKKAMSIVGEEPNPGMR
jgi:transposase